MFVFMHTENILGFGEREKKRGGGEVVIAVLLVIEMGIPGECTGSSRQ